MNLQEKLDECIINSKRKATELNTANEKNANLVTELAALGYKRKPVELLTATETKDPMPDAKSYFDLKKAHDQLVETNGLLHADIDVLNRDGIKLIEKNESQAECIRKMEQEFKLANEIIDKGPYPESAATALLQCNEKRQKLGDELRECREKFTVEEKNSLNKRIREMEKELKDFQDNFAVEVQEASAVPLDKHAELAEEFTEIQARYDESIKKNIVLRNQLSEAVDPGILAGCKIRVKELNQKLVQLEREKAELIGGEAELTKDLYRFNEINKGHIRTIEDLQVENKDYEKKFDHVYNQLQELIVEVKELKK